MTVLRERNPRAALPSNRAEHTWKPLLFLNLYRLLLAGLLGGLFLSGLGPSPLGESNPGLFRTAVLLYFAFAALGLGAALRRNPRFDIQVHLGVLADLAALTVLMHASGGLLSGMGILVVVAVAGSSIITAGRMAILYAALGTLTILAEQVYAHAFGVFEKTAYTHAGLLGMTLFATALLAYILAQRARESEALALQRGIDLANMEQLNDYVVRNLQAGVVVVDENHGVRMINDAAWRLLGEPAIGDRQQLTSVAPALERQLQRWLDDDQTAPESFQAADDAPVVLPHFTRLGTARSGRGSATLIFLEDTAEVTQRMQQMKLASLGRLTASIAHEIRNPLGAISHAAQLLEETDGLDKNDTRLTEIIRTHTKRVNTIVESVLQLSRRQQSRPERIDLETWLEKFVDEFCAINELETDLVRVDVDPAHLQAFMDPNHLHQVVWNLAQNALKHGQPAHEGHRITFRAGIEKGAPGPFLDVIDNGPGISPEQAENIFDPFFTTAAQGTGLGLYLSRELCECNRARLSYQPAPTGGSRFRISFPDPDRTTG